MYERMKHEESHYMEALISTDAAMGLIDPNTLVVAVDTHRPSYTEAPEILSKVDKIVLIDHHRRSEEYIDNPLLDYIEPYASSACELVSELVQYMDDHIKLTKFEADALLAGIVLDTNSFTFKTGVRTGPINVQVIMEYLGGGGHLNMAGAQIQTQDINEAKTRLYEAISHYKKESKK